MKNTTEQPRLLVVSREPAILQTISAVGDFTSWYVETAKSGWEALERFQSGIVPDLLLLEVPGINDDGLHLLRWLRPVRPTMPIILLSYHSDVPRDKQDRLGVQDMLFWPFDEKQVESAIRAQLSSTDHMLNAFTDEDIEELDDGDFFVGVSPVMQKFRAQAELAAQANVPLLILGEAGSGRDTAARLIHRRSTRSECRFLKINCAASAPHVLEKELFGNRQGPVKNGQSALTKFELCRLGTILLDEICELPIALQEKLLQVMQQPQTLQPSLDACIDVGVRVFTASDAESVERALSRKKLREDLYYHLSAVTVDVPALRQRKDDVPFLLNYFMQKVRTNHNLPAREVSPAVLDACQQYSWPGNVRELESFVKRYLTFGDQSLSSLRESVPHRHGELLSSQATNDGTSSCGDRSLAQKSLKSLINEVKSDAERAAIVTALERTRWNRKAAARLLEVSYRTMLYKIERYQIDLPTQYSSSH